MFVRLIKNVYDAFYYYIFTGFFLCIILIYLPMYKNDCIYYGMR